MKLLLDYTICGSAKADDGQLTGTHIIAIERGFQSLSERLKSSLDGVVKVSLIDRSEGNFGLHDENFMEPSIDIEVTIETADACEDVNAVSQKLNEGVAAMISEFDHNLMIEAEAELMRFMDKSPEGTKYIGDEAIIKAVAELNQNEPVGDNNHIMKPLAQWLEGSGFDGLAKMAKVYIL